MPDINHGSQFGKKSPGHANWPDDDRRNFLYQTESLRLVVAVVVGCFIKGLHFRLVTLYFGDMKRLKYKPQLNCYCGETVFFFHTINSDIIIISTWMKI